MANNVSLVNNMSILSNNFVVCRFINNIYSTQIIIINLIFKHEIMELSINKPTNVKKVKATNGKTIQFFNAEGVIKVFDVHQYSNTGTLFFKRKNKKVFKIKNKKAIVYYAIEY